MLLNINQVEKHNKMKIYRVKHNITDERFECIASSYAELKTKCHQYFGNDDILIIVSHEVDEAK